MTELEYTLSQLQQQQSTEPVDYVPQTSTLAEEKLSNLSYSDKLNKLSIARDNKQLALRKDTVDYGNDNWLVESAKSFANEFLPHEYQIPVNKDGKRYNTANKDFNNDDLTNLWNKYEDNPAGNKVLYYLRKLDPATGQYMYKPGIAHTSAADRYLGQAQAQGYEVIGEKRFDEASAVEKQIHGNSEFLKHRVYDYGTTGEGGAEDYWGSGKSELYNKDILGLDTGTSEQYAENKRQSIKKMLGIIPNERQREDTFEFIDAFQAGGINLAGGVVKLIGEGVSNSEGDGVIEAWGKKLQKDANKIAGYNPVGAAEAAKGLKDSFERGDVVGYVGNMLKGSPQWLAQSLPNMGAFAATSMAATATTGNPIVGLMAGSTFLGAIRANDILDTREEKLGRKATKEEVASIYATSSALALLEYGALKYAFTGKGLIGKDASGKTINLSETLLNTPRKRRDVASILGGAGTQLGKGSIAEGGEEVVSGLTEFLMENYGTETYKGESIADMLTSSEAKDTAVISFGAGAGAGGLAGTPKAIKDIGSDVRKNKIAENMTQEQGDILKESEALQSEYAEATPERQEEIYTRLQELEAELADITSPKTVNPLEEDGTVEEPTEATMEDVPATETETETTTEVEDTPISRFKSIQNEIEELSKSLPEGSTNEERAALKETLIERKQQLKEAKKAVEQEYIPIMTQQNIEAGMNEADAKKSATDTVKLLTAPGIASILTKAGNKIAIEPITSAVKKDKTNKKEQTFNPLRVTPGVFTKALDGKLKPQDVEGLLSTNASTLTVSTVNALTQGSDTNKAIREVRREVRAAIESNPKVKGMVQNLLNTNDADLEADLMQIVALVMSGVDSGIEAESNIRSGKGLVPSDKAHTRSLGLNSALGKALLNSDGMAITGTEQDTAVAYAEIGNKMFDIVEELGMIEREIKNVPVQNLVDPTTGETVYDQKRLSEIYGKEGTVIGSEKASGKRKVSTIQNKVVMIKGDRSKQLYGLKVLSRLINPTNMQLPTTEPVEKAITDRGVSKLHKDTIKALNKMPFQIKPEFIDLLKDIKKQIGDMTLDKAFYHNKELRALVGIEDSNTALIKDSESGRNMGRKKILRDLLDNIDTLEEMSKEGMHFQYEGAINHRIHLLQTVLDFQGDKRVARRILSGKEYTTDKNGAEVLLNALSEETGLEIKDILEPKGKLKETLDAYTEGDNGLSTAIEISKVMGIANPMEAMSLFQAIRDVYIAKDKSKITTDYMVEYDAVASGVTNTLMNLSGNPEVQKVLALMGIGPDAAKGDDIIDPYQHQNSTFIENSKTEKGNIAIGNKPAIDAMNEYASIIDNGKGKVKKVLRDIAKYPVLKWFYGESEVNTKAGMAKEMAQNLALAGIHDYNQAAVDKINEITGKNYVIDNEEDTKNLINDITPADIDTVAEYYIKTFTEKYVSNLDRAFPGVNAYRATMDKIYDILTDTGTWDSTIGTAITALEIKRIRDNDKLSQKEKDAKIAKVRETNKASLQKLKATLSDAPLDGQAVQVNKMYNNRTSLKVNLQHISDAAQMLMTMSDYTGTYEDAVMTVHDAIYGNANNMDFIKESYEKNMLDTASEYDFVQAGIEAAKEAINNMPEGENKVQMKERLAEIENVNNPLLEAKREFLGTTGSIDMFGQTGRETKVNTKPEPKPEAKPKPKKENKFLKQAKNWIEDRTNKVELVNLLKTMKVSDTHKHLLDKLLLNLDAIDGVELDEAKEYAGMDNVIYLGEDIDGSKTKDPRTHQELTPDTLVEILAHEMDHAVNFNYLSNNMKSGEVQYLLRQLENLYKANKDAVSQKTMDRINYVMYHSNPTNDDKLASLYAVSEFVSVMRNEPDVAAEISQVLYKSAQKKGLDKLMDTIKKIVTKAYERLKGMTSKERSALFTDKSYNSLDNTVKAMEVVMLNAEDNNKIKSKGTRINDLNGAPRISSIPKDKVYKATKEDMYRYAGNIVDRHNSWMADMIGIWGEAFIDVVGPIASKGHQELRGKFALYRGASNLVREHFYDTRFAQEMRSTLGLSQDYNKKLMNKLLSLGTSIQQDTADILTKQLVALEKEINLELKSKEDRKALFTAMRTGIGALGKYPQLRKKMMKGPMTIDEIMMDLNIDKDYKKKIESVANYYVTGKMENGWINPHKAGMIDPKYAAAVAMVAFNKVEGHKVVQKLSYPLRRNLIGLYTTVKHLNDEINTLEREYSGKHDSNYSYDDDYDGHYTMDVMDKHEFKVLSEREMSSSEYSKDNDWIVIRKASKGIDGIVARVAYSPGYTQGVGLNVNKFKNGFYLNREESQALKRKLEVMTEAEKQEYLNNNQIVEGNNGEYRYLIDLDTSINKLGMKSDAANSVMRTYAHNKELIEMGAVRSLIMTKATYKITNQKELDKLEELIKESNEGGNVELPMFLKISDEMLKEFDEYPEGIRLKYMTPNGSLSTFNNFNRNITLVKKGESTALIGHHNSSVFNNRTLAKWEKGWKEFVVLAKQHMIVTDIGKLAVDAASNITILETKGVSTIEILRRFKTGWKAYNQLSKIRGEIVIAEMKVRMKEDGTPAKAKAEKELEHLNKRLRASHFYDAFNYGFVQSYSTSLVLDNFDSVSGLQKNIDDIVESWTKDEKGNPNELFKAIKWWQEFGASKGFTVDSLIEASVKLSKAEGTTIGEEMIKMSKRLKSDKDIDSVARYVSNIIGGPASEIVKVGSAAMVTIDVLSKYTLATSLMNKINPKTKRKYTKEEAYMEANDTFIDYRRNMPAEIKALSDYGILMFPNFWMKVQVVIARMIRYQPSTAVGGYAIADFLGVNDANILDTNIINRLSDGLIINEPTNLIDWKNLLWFL